jgi:hypothetical protein
MLMVLPQMIIQYKVNVGVSRRVSKMIVKKACKITVLQKSLCHC